MKVTRDEYELPLAVADSSAELARIVGVKEGTIRGCVSRVQKRMRRSKKGMYVVVEFSDQEWEDT